MIAPKMELKHKVIQSDQLKMLLIGSVLVILTLIPYWQLKDHDFVNYDDPFHISDSPTLRKGFTPAGIVCTFTFCAATREAPHWHPVTWLSWMLDYRLYGLNPAGYLLTNLSLHIANVFLLFLILNRMTHAPWRSAFVAALFAVHPLHVESVAWATERRDVLSTFWGFLTVGAYLYYIGRPVLWKYILMLAFFAIGLMSKSILVTLPFVLLLLDYWPLRRLSLSKQTPANQPTPKASEPKATGKKSSRQASPPPAVRKFADTHRVVTPRDLSVIWEKVPLIVLSILAGFMTFYFHKSLGGITMEIPFMRRLGNAALSYGSYIWKTFWPADLAVFYPYQNPLPTGPVIISVALLLLITAGVIYFRNRKPYLLTGWFWYLGTLVPVIGIVLAGHQAMADRYMYIPLVGLSIMITWGLSDVTQKLPQRKFVMPLAAITVLIGLTAATWKQVGYWKNSIALFEHAIAATSGNYLAHRQLGTLFFDRGETKEALHHFSESVRIKPDYALARAGLGNTLMRQGRLDEAERQFREAMRIDPHYLESYWGMGALLQARGKADESAAFLRKALEIDPANAKTHFLLGEFLFVQGKTNDAMAFYRRAIELNPLYADAAYNDLGIALRSQGRIPEAMAQYREAIRINPRNINAYMNLGNILVSQGQTEEGVRQFQIVLQIDPGNINALNRLGSALLIQGKTAEAISYFRRVLNINPQDPTALQALQYIESKQKRGANR